MSNWATVAAALAAAIALVINAVVLWFNARQFRLNRAQTRAEFLLKLEEAFSPYDDVRRKLHPAGEWQKPGKPESPQDWARLDEYLGVFERTKLLLDLGLVDPPMYNAAFGYRLRNIVANPVIVEERFRKRAVGWFTFLQLLKELDISLPEYFEER